MLRRDHSRILCLEKGLISSANFTGPSSRLLRKTEVVAILSSNSSGPHMVRGQALWIFNEHDVPRHVLEHEYVAGLIEREHIALPVHDDELPCIRIVLERQGVPVDEEPSVIADDVGEKDRNSLVFLFGLSPHVLAMGKELLAMVKPLKKVVNEDFYVLTNDEHPTEPRTYRNYYNSLMKKLDIPKLKYHGLRHSFATRCIEAGCDYKTVSVLLGHSSISTTLNLYVHPNMEQKKRCITKMFKSLGK